MTRWDQGAGRIPELNVYGPAHTARMTELIIGKDGIFGPDLAARTQLRMSQDVFVARGGTLPRKLPQPVVREVTSGETIECGGFSVHARAVLHAQPFLECFGYRMEADGSSFVYSETPVPARRWKNSPWTATCSCTCAISSAAPRSAPRWTSTTWATSSSRVSVRARDVRNLVVSHVTEQMDVPGVRERLIHEMSALYAGNLFFGEDLMEIPVGPPVPAKLD